MNLSLQRYFNVLEADRLHLLEKVSKLSPEHLHRAPPGKWSISQILAHLVAAERLSVQYMNKKILGMQEAENTSIVEEMKMVLLKISQRLPFKFKAPKAVVDITPSHADLRELEADWNNARAELKNLLEKFDDTLIKKKIYKHIRAGRLNIQHALIFFHDHSIHHWPQIKRLL